MPGAAPGLPLLQPNGGAHCPAPGLSGAVAQGLEQVEESLMHPNKSRRGFTLIELLIVVVIIGILAAIAIPKFQETKGKSYAASLKSDLKNLSSAQEDYFYYNEQYTMALGSVNFSPSPGVVLTITEASARGWSATTTHPASFPLTCAVYYGQAAAVSPAVSEGLVACQ